MFRIKNKKGFTLVELMIVVVILGILVAIAVPIFSSVTKSAKKKSCQSNMRVMLGIAVQIGTENDGKYEKILTSETIPAGGQITLTGNDDLSDEFLGKLKNHEVPVCPSNGTYTLSIIGENGVNITCSEADHN